MVPFMAIVYSGRGTGGVALLNWDTPDIAYLWLCTRPDRPENGRKCLEHGPGSASEKDLKS